MKASLSLFLISTTLLSSCGMNRLMKDATRTIQCNIAAGEQATQMVYQNMEAMREANMLMERANQLLAENIHSMEAMQEANTLMKRANQLLAENIYLMEALNQKMKQAGQE